MRWSDATRLGELNAVLSPSASERRLLLMHAASLYGAKVALAWIRRRGRRTGVVLDFGCGNGRLLRFFGRRGWAIVGTEVTPEMLLAAQRFGLPERSVVILGDGVSVPLRDASADLIWVCGVLKYSLFPPDAPSRGRPPTKPGESPSGAPVEAGGLDAEAPFVPAYPDIAREMYRALKPGALVVNFEMHVNAPPEVFTRDFEQAGFKTERIRVLRRDEGRLERLCQWRDWRRLPSRCVMTAGQLIAAARFRLDNPRRATSDFRDYLFIWSKPLA